MQNTNPASVAPDQTKVKQGLAREDLFTCVHEQFMTETAKFADIVLPATMFLEHDDIYQGGGHSHLLFGRKLVEAPGECRSNHEVICDLADARGRRASGLPHEPARADRLDAGQLQAPRPRNARRRELDRRDAALRAGAFPRRASATPTASSTSAPTGARCASAAPTGRWARWTSCRPSPIIARRSRRRRRSIPSASPPARPAPSSTRPSTRRRRR